MGWLVFRLVLFGKREGEKKERKRTSENENLYKAKMIFAMTQYFCKTAFLASQKWLKMGILVPKVMLKCQKFLGFGIFAKNEMFLARLKWLEIRDFHTAKSSAKNEADLAKSPKVKYFWQSIKHMTDFQIGKEWYYEEKRLQGQQM